MSKTKGKEHSTQKNEKQKTNKFYYSYNKRLILNCVVFIVLLIAGTNFLIKAFTLEEAKVINYAEHSNLDYKVYLKTNNFYDDEYLPKDMLYVANLIDKIKIDFNYQFSIEESIDLMFEYELLGKLIIQDETESNTYYEKEYNLLNKQSITLKDNKTETINETIEIDYDEYNRIANSFKTSYGLNTKSKLIVYFNINKDTISDEDKNVLINDSVNNMIINIPLSEKSVDINLNYKDINNESRVLDNSKVVIDNIVYLIIAIISIITSLVLIVKIMRLLKYIVKKKNVYDKYIERILNEYDRLIVETTSSPILKEEDKEKVIMVEKFTELLDVRDNLKQPIMYYIVTKHQKCHFYINSGEKIYLTTIKKVDLEVQNEKK